MTEKSMELFAGEVLPRFRKEVYEPTTTTPVAPREPQPVDAGAGTNLDSLRLP
jgi:hypothetical protein